MPGVSLNLLRGIRFVMIGCFLLFTEIAATAQVRNATAIDSLQKEIQSRRAVADTAVISLYIGLSEAYSSSSTALGLRYADTALQLARSISFDRGAGDAANLLGINSLERADYPKALEYFFEALRIREAMGDAGKVARTQNNIGLVFARTSNFLKARMYYERAYNTLLTLRDTTGMATMLVNVGMLCEQQDSLRAASGFYAKAAALGRATGSPEVEALAIGNAGVVANREGNYEEAIRDCLTALRLCESVGDRYGIVRNLGNIGGCYLDAATDANATPPGPHLPADPDTRLRLAIRYLRGAVDSAEALGYPEAVKVFAEKLSLAHKEAGEQSEALAAYEKYSMARDSIQSVESAARISELETERELLLRDKQIELDRLAVTKKRNERMYFIAGLGLLGVVTFFIARERKKSERLLLNILPEKIATRLKAREHPIADSFAGVSIMFIDMVGFTQFVERHEPREIVSILNDVFTRFDALAGEHGLEKIKTIGDSYMAVAGVPDPCADHADRAARTALAACRTMQDYRSPEGEPIRFRIGLDCGPVVAGVIGRRKFIYDLWGDAVNTAARMESSGLVGEIQCTDRFKNSLKGAYNFTARGRQEVKGKGVMETWLLREALPPAAFASDKS